MKNRKGEIATLLTLGLILVGAVATIATSLFTNNQKNIASNPKAAGVNCVYGDSAECTNAKRMGDCPQGNTGTCQRCSNGTYRCPGTTDNTVSTSGSGSSARTAYYCPGSTTKQYWIEAGKYYKTAIGTTPYTSITAICGDSTSSCVGTATYHTCKSDNAAYTLGGYYPNNGKYFEDSKCKTQITVGVGNYCKNKNPAAAAPPAQSGAPAATGTNGLCCKLYTCNSAGTRQVTVVGFTGVKENGAVGYTSCATTGYSNVYNCSEIPDAPTTNGATGTTSYGCSGAPAGGGATNLGGAEIPTQGGGGSTGQTGGAGVVGPGQSCCFTKKGLIYEYATYQSMVNGSMPLDCSRQTGALVNSYQALDPPGAFVCNTGSAGSPYDGSQIISPEEPLTVEPPTTCQPALNASDCSDMGREYGISMTFRTTSKMCCPIGVNPPIDSNLPACQYDNYFSAATSCGLSGFNSDGCKSGTYKCIGTAAPGNGAINYGSANTCSNNPAIKYYKVGSKYYKSTSDTTGTTILSSICVDPVANPVGGTVNCKDTAKYNSRDCGFRNSATKVCNKTSNNYYFGIGANTDTNYYNDSCSVLGSSKDQGNLSKALDQYCGCGALPQGYVNAINPDSKVNALNGTFYQCKLVGQNFSKKTDASSVCTTCSSWMNSLRGHVNCAVTKQGVNDYNTYCCDVKL